MFLKNPFDRDFFSRFTLAVEVSLNIRCFLCRKNCKNKHIYSLLISLVKRLICFALRLFHITTSNSQQGALLSQSHLKLPFITRKLHWLNNSMWVLFSVIKVKENFTFNLSRSRTTAGAWVVSWIYRKSCQLDIISRINELQSNGPSYFIFSNE